MNTGQKSISPCRGCGEALEQGTLNAQVVRQPDGKEEIILRHLCGTCYSSPVFLRTLAMSKNPLLKKPCTCDALDDMQCSAGETKPAPGFEFDSDDDFFEEPSETLSEEDSEED